MQNSAKNGGDKMLLALCPACAAQFYNSERYIIRRVRRSQHVKESCTYCNRGRGYDYVITNREDTGRNANVHK